MDYQAIAKGLRKQIIMMHAKSNGSHVGSALSSLDILIVLYFCILKIDRATIGSKNRNTFILSKGHAVSALYAVLAKKGLLAGKYLKRYCINKTGLPGHCTKGCVKGIEVSTGSLGHGLSIGAGMALAKKHDGLRSKIFVLLSDGECDEGSVWEAAMFAGHHKLNNLIAIIDYNKIQAFGRTKEVLDLEPLKDKWEAFGWSVKEVNGHNFKELSRVLKNVPFNNSKPSVVIAHTIKGKGVSFMENKLEWHYRSPDNEQLKMALRELE
ncbi:MAG: transketolase [Candidatus Omnitrophica bacterium]|nr:transketolase [Candidatus Omnitrophota bacterium]